MKHRFKNTCYNATELLAGCTNLRSFITRLTNQSNQNPLMWDPMTYRGDGFEALVEILISHSFIDKRVNITNYQPWDPILHGPDYGIDGIGTSHAGHPHTVQIKFRTDPTVYLTPNEDHISNFVAKSLCMYYMQDVSMTIFTTANSLRQDINDNMYHSRIRVIGYNDLKKLVDNNLPFWQIFLAEMTCNT